ncbi:MAG: 5-formyltetrahydrofolate cyclo-ligase [Gammaproteobacteria bacterium]|nr:5-formyltetrahydrofolate cyclo-ligase [Gammaproteobacteria bacterium]
MNRAATPAPLRQQIRQQVRLSRQQLSQTEQQQASQQLVKQLIGHPKLQQATKVAIYLANDGELDPMPLIEALWRQGKEVYLPRLHPFSAGNLIFIRYQANSPMVSNKYGIKEPKLDVTKLCPTAQLDIIFTPLVAFDRQGNRMGMGGGYYDRTLGAFSQGQGPYPIGLAHECQQVDSLPIAAWDIPLPQIITPSQIYNR